MAATRKPHSPFSGKAGQHISPFTQHNWPTRIITREELDSLQETDRVIAERFIETGRWALKPEKVVVQ